MCSAGEHHRKQRKLLNPVFSINHMRHMMPTFYNVTYKVRAPPPCSRVSSYLPLS